MPSPAGYLLDTNILVHLIRGNALGRHIDRHYALSSSLTACTICVVTVGEMNSLARRLGWGEERRETLGRLLDEIVWIDINHPQILAAYGEIDASSTSRGQTLGKNDVWIAATAHVANVPLLTTDRDFEHLDGTYMEVVYVDPGSVS